MRIVCWITTSAGAGDLAKLAHQFAGELVVGVHVRAVDLHIDRRRGAEVENFCGQIGRLEREFGARIAFPQALAEDAPVVPHRRLFILQEDRQVTILGADRRRRNEGEVMRSDRQAAITDDVFDLTGQQLLRCCWRQDVAMRPDTSMRVPSGARICIAMIPDLISGK